MLSDTKHPPCVGNIFVFLSICIWSLISLQHQRQYICNILCIKVHFTNIFTFTNETLIKAQGQYEKIACYDKIDQIGHRRKILSSSYRTVLYKMKL